MINNLTIDSLASPLRPLSPTEFNRIKNLVYDRFGLDLREGKEELISARLGKKIRDLGFKTYSEYLDYVTKESNGPALAEMVDLLTTNFTSFFREHAHFDFAKKLLPQLVREKGRVRMWSAACSSGEEPYSIAMLCAEEVGPGRVQVVATDISNRVLAKARDGVYATDRLTGIPPDLLPKYFLRGHGVSSGLYRIKPLLTKDLTFRHLNLMDPYTHEAPFDFIWCRNVMIYFDKPTQERVVKKLSEWLENGGYLFIGHSEALTGIDHSLEYVQPAIYRKGRASR